MFANCVHTRSMFLHVFEREIFFSINFSKIAVECDWNGKKFKIWVFLEKYKGLFLKKILKVLQNRYMWQIFSRTRLKWFFS